MVGRYFDKRRSLANGLSVAGSGVGSFLFPPLMQLLIEKYTINGCILILGALCLHLCVAGLLYRPLPTRRIIVVEPAVYDEVKNDSQTTIPLFCKNVIPSCSSIKEELYETALYPGASCFAMASSLLSIPEQIVIVEQPPRSRLRHFSGVNARKKLRNAVLSLYAWPKRLRSGADRGSLFDFSLLKDSLFLSFSFAVMLGIPVRIYRYTGIYIISFIFISVSHCSSFSHQFNVLIN